MGRSETVSLSLYDPVTKHRKLRISADAHLVMTFPEIIIRHKYQELIFQLPQLYFSFSTVVIDTVVYKHVHVSARPCTV